MRLFLFALLLFQVGCATKYILPGNRFLTPESQGGNLRSQIELQSVGANQLTVKTEGGGVNSVAVDRTAYLFATSLFEQFDFYWSHTGGGNSIFGGKFQLMGPSRASGSGHKLALAGGVGGNEHELEGDPQVEFELTAQEILAIYGYRFNETILLYTSIAKSKYKFTGSISSSNPTINGLKPNNVTDIMAAYAGSELNFLSLVGKVECGYQQLDTTASKKFTNVVCGWSLGFQW
jgi:hypothetical protein